MPAVLIQRTVRRPASLAPAVEASCLALRSRVAMTVPMQVLAHVIPPAEMTGEAHQVIAPVGQVANGRAVTRGSADQTVSSTVQTAAGTHVALGQAGQLVAGAGQAATGHAVKTGAAVLALAPVGQVASGSAVATGSAAQVIAPLHQDAYQEAVARGSADQTIAPLTQEAAGHAVKLGAAAQSVAAMDQAATGSAVAMASGDQISGGVTQTAQASAVAFGGSSQSSEAVTQSASGSVVKVAVTAQAIGVMAQAVAGSKVANGQAVQVLAALAQSVAGSAVAKGHASQTVAAMTWAASGSAVAKGAAGQTIAAMVQTAFGSSGVTLPTYVGVAPFVNGTGAISPTFASSGRASGDLLLLFVESANQAVTTPSGWGLLPSTPQSTGTAAAAGGVRLTAFYKVSDGTETTVSIADSGDHTTACGLVVRGVDTTVYTNLLSNSSSLTNTAYWNVFNGATIAANATVGPDGVTTTARLQAGIQSTQVGSAGISSDSFDLLAPGTTVTVSCWARGTSATQSFALNGYAEVDGGATDIISPDKTVGTTWTKVSHTFTVPSGTSNAYNNVSIKCASTLAAYDILVTDWQLETGSSASPSLRTATAAGSSIKGIVAQAGKVQAATTSVSFPAPLTPVPALVVNALANDRDAAATGNLTSVTNADLTSLTTRIDQTVVDGQGGGLAIITGGKSPAGVITATTATNAASVANASITLALAA